MGERVSGHPGLQVFLMRCRLPDGGSWRRTETHTVEGGERQRAAVGELKVGGMEEVDTRDTTWETQVANPWQPGNLNTQGALK